MSWFSNLRLRARLMVSFTAVIALTAVLGVFSVMQLRSVSKVAADAAEVWGRKAQLAGEMNTATGDMRIFELQSALANNDAERDRFEASSKERTDFVNKVLAQYTPLVTEAQEKALIDKFLQDWTAYKDEHYKLTLLAQSGKVDGVRSWASGPSKDVYDRFSHALTELVEFNAKGVKGANEHGRAVSQSAMWAVAAGVVVVAVLGLGLAYAVSGQVVAPLADAVDVMKAVAEGDLTRKVDTHRHDELGDVQRALAAMQQRLSGIVQDVRQGADAVATASSQIAQGNTDLSARTESQASSLEQTAASVEEMAGTVRTNGARVQYQGLEFNYAQNLTFLPKPFNGLDVQANYSYTNVKAKDSDPFRQLDTYYSALRAVAPQTVSPGSR